MELVANFTLNNEELNAEFDISEIDNFDAVFQIDAAGTTWGSIDGTLSNQTDLQQALDLKANQSELDITNDTVSNLSNTVTDNYNTLDDKISDNTQDISDINTILSGYGDIVTHDVNEFATASQGTLADSALQPDDNISELTNNVGYITSSALDGYATENYVDAGLATKQNTLTAGANVQIVNNTISATDTTYTAGQGISIVNGTISNTQTSAEWGNIQGTLSNQIDLQNALNAKYNASNPNGYQANVIEAIEVNGITETVTNKTVNISVPTTATEIGALPSDTTIEDLTTTAQQDAIDSGATATNISQITTNENNISDIQDLIPIAATSSNQLADKSFVNSSIATNTANFIGTFNSVAELEAYTGTLTNNDYAFVETTDSAGNTLYDRYKYTDATNPPSWQFEYELNNSSFTANQWAAINSGITDTEVAQIATNTSDIATKQDIINDLSTIRSGASLGATSLQPNDNITELNNNAGYITGINSSDVTTALGYTPYSDSNPNGYITGITGSDVTTALGYTPYNSTNPNGYITSSALNGYATEIWVGQQGYITGITSSDVTTALGYTPYNSSNPSGYTSNIGTVTSVNGNTPDGTGAVTISIPTVNDATLTINQGGVQKGTFTANASSNVSINLDGNQRNIGEIIPSTIPLTDAGLHLLDGALISGSGSYSAFVDYIADLYDSGDYTAIFETEANWQSAVTTNGVCGKFVYDSVNNTVRLPKYSNKIYTKDITSTAPVKGNGMTLGITNGSFNAGFQGRGESNALLWVKPELYGTSVGTAGGSGNTFNAQSLGITTDGTKSGIIANLANITTSLDGYYYIVIATSTKTDIEVDIDEIATDLNGKADVDLTNLSATASTNFDGQLVSALIQLLNSDTIPYNITGGGTVYTFDLSSYLPNDGYDYEVLLSLEANGVRFLNVFAYDNDTDIGCSFVKNYFANGGGSSGGTTIVQIGSNRVLKLSFICDIANTTVAWARCVHYRRIGTNS